MSFYLILSRTPIEMGDPELHPDLHPTDIVALKPFESQFCNGYVREEDGKLWAQFLGKGDAAMLCALLGPIWEDKINKYAPPSDFSIYADRLNALLKYLGDYRALVAQIANLFRLMGNRGIGGYLSW